MMLAATRVLAANFEHGREIFKACAACHTGRPDALGPSLKGIIGRKPGAIEDFRYSNAMKRADFIWTEATLRGFLQNPQGKVKGNRMPFSGLDDPTDIDDVLAFIAGFEE
jgi:cytochrome c